MTERGRARRRSQSRDRVQTSSLAAIRSTIERRALLKGGERVVLAVSGGADSLTLLYAMHRLAPAFDLDLHVAHFDHRLRPGSDRDAAFVARHAATLGLPATLGAAESTERPPGLSPEEAARERRQRFLNEVAETVGAARIATGHTLDDQAETVLMRFLLGSGPRGLGGIDPLRWWRIRPLIDLRRAETEAFCRALGLRPRRDPTNEDPAFLRNVIRHETIPFLTRTINARLPEALARFADVIRDEDVYMHGQMLEQAPPDLTDERAGRLDVEVLRALPVALQRRAVRYLAANQGLRLDHDHTEAVRMLALHGQTGQQHDLPGALNARLEYGFLVIGRAAAARVPASPVELAIPGETDLSPWDLRMRAWLTTEHPVRWPDGRTTAVLDADRVAFPLRVRRWRPGDRFRPLGMARQKKVGDFFTDEKVPKERRAVVPIVVGSDERIVWVVGFRPDDRAKVTPATRRFCWLSAEGATS